MAAINADNTYQLLQPDPAAQFLLVNNDEASSVYISQQKPVTKLDTQIPPQGSVGLTGLWYVSTLSTAVQVQCFVLAGGSTWSNPIGVQIALDLQGLAKDATVAAVPGMIQSMGAPPFIPNAEPFGLVNAAPAGSPYTIFTATADTFIWYALLSFAGSSNASHVGNDQMFAALHLASSSKPLVPIEIALGDAASADSGVGIMSIGGVAIEAGDAIILNVNGGMTVTNTEFRASCVVIVGTP